MFQLNYRSEDLPAISTSTPATTPPATTPPDSVNSNSPSDTSITAAGQTTAASQGGISTGAAVGIGIGAALGGAILIAAVVGWVWLKKRKQRAGAAAAEAAAAAAAEKAELAVERHVVQPPKYVWTLSEMANDRPAAELYVHYDVGVPPRVVSEIGNANVCELPAEVSQTDRTSSR
jgi:hypothetical protein